MSSWILVSRVVRMGDQSNRNRKRRDMVKTRGKPDGGTTEDGEMGVIQVYDGKP